MLKIKNNLKVLKMPKKLKNCALKVEKFVTTATTKLKYNSIEKIGKGIEIFAKNKLLWMFW